jgi:oligopeptidase B
VSKRQYRLYRHTAGTAGPDTLVYEEKDERFDVSATKTLSRAYIFLVLASHTTSEARYIPADQPMAEFRVMEPRRQGVEYYADHNGDSFYLRVNDTGRNFRLVKAPVADPESKNWQEVVGHDPKVMIDDTDFFKNYYVLYERENGLPQIRVTDLRTGQSRRIEFPEPAYAAYSYINRVYDTTRFRYGYQSAITPASVFAYDMEKATSTLLKQKEVPGGYDRSKYQVEQIYAPAMDGVEIPISVVYLKGTKLDGNEALYLYGYGSYGVSIDMFFNSNIFSMVDRGVVTAVAHIRGGGEMGKAWHDAGRMMNKRTTFTDFISSAEYLTTHGYGSKDRLVIEGRSAGGLLMGSVLNLRPDLFHAALVGVPFVDVMNTMLDESLPLTVGEFEEWGNPKEKAAFDYMITYSPYDNVEAKAYPNMLVKTSFNDSQVMYWEPAKYVAKMRALRTDHNTLILKTNLSPAGHGGASGRYDRLKESAFDYAWILGQMGIAQ